MDELSKRIVKRYVGTRTGTNFPTTHVDVVDERTGERKTLHHMECHSPDGFEWGYPGSGPADLALSILADWFGESAQDIREGEAKSWRYYQAFKFKLIAEAPREGFEILGLERDFFILEPSGLNIQFFVVEAKTK